MTTLRKALEQIIALSEWWDDDVGVIDADKAKAIARAALSEPEWHDMASAPKDGTWFLFRGRNAVGFPMVPVVIAWAPAGSKHIGWVDSASFRPMDSEVAYFAPTLDGRPDWRPLPRSS